MENDKNLYELSYLLIPIVSAEKLPDEVNAIRAIIESNGGLILNEEQPKAKDLAYEISHVVAGGKRTRYESAYFGWMKFNLAQDAVSGVEVELKKNNVLLRYLIINLTRDIGNPPKNDSKKAQIIKKTKKVSSDKEIDKEIENLLIKSE